MQYPARLPLPALCVASALLAASVGASYAYVDLSLNRMGATAAAIGLNGAMPALGWLLATPLMPWALRRFPPRAVLLLLGVAALAVCLFPLTDHQGAWLALRFLFGGGCGMVFRLVEYWISAGSDSRHRARNVGIYSVCFCCGAAVGAGVLPLVGLAGWPPVLFMLALASAGFAVFAALRSGPPAVERAPAMPLRALAGLGMVAMAGALLFGMFEAVPYTLMPVHAVRAGLAETEAAWLASAFLLGQVLLLVPLGLAADRLGKRRVLALCAAGALALAVLVPAAGTDFVLLAAMMLAWGGVAGTLYVVSLALLADLFSGPELAAGNATFGTLYALGALLGPLAHGLAMDAWPPDGLFISAALLLAAFCAILLPWRGLGGVRA
ncbi:MFS transporter [Niveispirillum fermenti]|uniref:MFS transporter n=1 Tax=Niveispirillum fermenti TaxID=1233113 RepID=UPI003A86C694